MRRGGVAGRGRDQPEIELLCLRQPSLAVQSPRMFQEFPLGHILF
jgi:hypothetical protein